MSYHKEIFEHQQKSLRIIFMGTPEFALPALEALFASHHKVVAVYAQPAREKGRGYTLQKNPTHLFAEKNEIPVFTPTSLKSEDEIQRFKDLKPDVAVVVAYGLILPKSILEIPPMGCVNIHGSLLPRWRGAAPIQRAIMEGDLKTGITTMLMDEGLDTGPMLQMKEVPITDETTTEILYEKLSILGAKLILSTLKGLQEKTLQPLIQPEEGITYANKLLKNEGEIDYSKSAKEVDCIIRGLTPQISIWLNFNDIKIKVLSAIPSTEEVEGEIGNVVQKNNTLYIICGKGILHILKVQPEGAKQMNVDAFLRGYGK
jgi:methionyl-tRNA formyltransferase